MKQFLAPAGVSLSMLLLPLLQPAQAVAQTRAPTPFTCQVDYLYQSLSDKSAALEAVAEKIEKLASAGDNGLQSLRLEISRLDRTVEVAYGLDGKLQVTLGQLTTGEVHRKILIADAVGHLESGEIVTSLPVSRTEEQSVLQELLRGATSVAVQSAQVRCEFIP